MIENSDFVCIINREYSSYTNQWYLTFKKIKSRGKEMSELTYFNHPFAQGNKMRLLDDYGNETLSELSLGNTLENLEDNEFSNKRNKKSRKKLDEEDDYSGKDVLKAILNDRKVS